MTPPLTPPATAGREACPELFARGRAAQAWAGRCWGRALLWQALPGRPMLGSEGCWAEWADLHQKPGTAAAAKAPSAAWEMQGVAPTSTPSD
jgi:hypothetical protein